MGNGDKIAILGLGGGGCRVLDAVSSQIGGGPPLIAVDTDAGTLAASRATVKVQIGESVTGGSGAGGDVETGRRAAAEDADKIRGLFDGTGLVLLVVSLGGGTGTGAAQTVLRCARDSGCATLCFATLPFSFEGATRAGQAQDVMLHIRQAADAVVVVPNDRLFESVEESNVGDAFRMADSALAAGVGSIWKMIAAPGLIDIDFAAVRRMVRENGGSCAFGYGIGRGPQKAEQALKSLLEGPLLDHGESLVDARALLVGVVGGHDLTLKEVEDIMAAISGKAVSGPETAMGTVVDRENDGSLSIVVIVSLAGRQVVPETQAASGAARKTRRSRKRPGDDVSVPKETQIDLGLKVYDSGRFKDIEPTIQDGEDLDIPTFVRRGIVIGRQ